MPRDSTENVNRGSPVDPAVRARVYELAQPFANGMPQSPYHPRCRLSLSTQHGDAVSEGRGSSAADLLTLGTHVGTHLDALCHVSQDGLLQGSLVTAEAQQHGGFSALGIETVTPLACRGVLIDIAGVRTVDQLPPATLITANDLATTTAATGIEVHAGAVALIRTGWAQLWNDDSAFSGEETGVPGPGIDAAAWLADRGIRATGSDTTAYGARAPAPSRPGHPVHRMLLVERGVHILEALQLEELARDHVYEFLFVAAPLRLVGATGSPLRPLALA